MRALVLIGGYLTSPNDFASLATRLEQPPYNFRVYRVPVGRLRWALTRDYDFRPVLRRIKASVEQARRETGQERVLLLAHSVAGVAARLYLGEEPYLGEQFAGRRYVERLVTLGTPHFSAERWTLKLYDYVNGTYPGAYYDDVQYVSVIGCTLAGRQRGTTVERMAFNSYKLVGGTEAGQEWGDGVASMKSAALPGAEYLGVADLYHSPFHGHPWYADVEGLPTWERALGVQRSVVA
jgi:pimeloyl-ACP methyl ester carboxylesterase